MFGDELAVYMYMCTPIQKYSSLIFLLDYMSKISSGEDKVCIVGGCVLYMYMRIPHSKKNLTLIFHHDCTSLRMLICTCVPTLKNYSLIFLHNSLSKRFFICMYILVSMTVIMYD